MAGVRHRQIKTGLSSKGGKARIYPRKERREGSRRGKQGYTQGKRGARVVGEEKQGYIQGKRGARVVGAEKQGYTQGKRGARVVGEEKEWNRI